MTDQRGRPRDTRQRHGPPGRKKQTSGTQVQIAGRGIALSQLRRAPGVYRALIEQAKLMDGCGWCLCSDPAPRLVIRHRAGVYYLACWPGGGQQHARDCEFYNDGSQWSGRSQYQASALQENEGGGASVALSLPLQVRTTSPVTASASSSDGGATRSRMGLLGLLHYLWERADLTRSAPSSPPQAGRRGWARCSPLVKAATAGVTSAGLPLAWSCYVVPPFDPAHPDQHDVAFARFTGRLGERNGTVQRGLLLGAVRSWNPTRYGQRCDLRHHRTPIFFSTALHERIRRAAPSAMTDRRPAGSEQVLLALVSRSEKGNLSAVGAAVMLTNADFVPADSTHEVVMADALTAAKRAFVKPLRYDGDSAVLPDFVLTDTEPATMVEVWGMLDREDYTARKEAKVSHYRSTGTPLIEWDVRERLPDLCRQPGD